MEINFSYIGPIVFLVIIQNMPVSTLKQMGHIFFSKCNFILECCSL